jgi:DeoR/GlpR family transcriptional regulator of sugar metabolism
MKNRLDQIVSLVNDNSFVSVTELSRLCGVSEMTIRRDLDKLDEKEQVRRIYGGATSIHPVLTQEATSNADEPVGHPAGSLINKVDVLIATSINLKADVALVELMSGKNIPIIAESQALRNQKTLVAVDNSRAGLELGRWAGQYALDHFGGQAHVLVLTSHFSNVSFRSRGFIAGIREVLPEADITLMVDAQSRFDHAYQITLDALTVHNHLNMIFAASDIITLGAIQACIEMNISPERMLAIPFGMEGNTLKNMLVEKSSYVKAGLAMFPEIVGPSCIEAAIAAYNHQALPNHLETPSVVLTPETIYDYYQPSSEGWSIRWDTVRERLSLPIELDNNHPVGGTILPKKIGFIIPFREHEWYQNLNKSMRDHAQRYDISCEILDVEQNMKEEIAQNHSLIAKRAAEQVHPGEVILIDGGPISLHLAEILAAREGLTIITNSIPIFDILKHNPKNILICTGGVYRSSSQLLVGPTAESTLRELRADRLFLQATGVSLDFGLSHTNISEVTIKRAMLNMSREIILLADSSSFGTESTIQITPLNVVHQIVTDDALPASIRLEINKLGIQIKLVGE